MVYVLRHTFWNVNIRLVPTKCSYAFRIVLAVNKHGLPLSFVRCVLLQSQRWSKPITSSLFRHTAHRWQNHIFQFICDVEVSAMWRCVNRQMTERPWKVLPSFLAWKKMETVGSSKTLLSFYQTTWSYVTEHRYLYIPRTKLRIGWTLHERWRDFMVVKRSWLI